MDDLEEPVAELVNARHASLPNDGRSALESVIASLRTESTTDSIEHVQAGYRYQRLLYSLDRSKVANPDLLADLADADRLQEQTHRETDEPALPWLGYGRPPEAGLESDDDRTVWQLVEPVELFANQHTNGMPDIATIESNAMAAADLRDALGSYEPSPEIEALAETALAKVVEVWTRRAERLPDGMRKMARALLLGFQAHTLPDPSHGVGDNGRIDLIPQGPRGEAARGLLQLARLPDCCDAELLGAVETLAFDPVPWVRYVIARDLPALRSTAPDGMWDLLRRIADHDTHDGVLRGVAYTAHRLSADPAEAIDLLRRVTPKVRPTGHPESALAACTEVAGLMWVVDGREAANQLLDTLLDLDAYGADGLTSLLHHIRDAGALTHSNDAVRARAIGLCKTLSQVGVAAVGDLQGFGPNENPDHVAKIKAGLSVVDGVASQLYFASGPSMRSSPAPEATKASQEVVRLVDETENLIRQIGAVPNARVAHNLVQLLEYVLDELPELVLGLVRDIVVTGGQAGGYQQDTMALDTTIRIVERLLADHRGILQTPTCLTALRELLDVFVDTGWPKAHRLVYGLEQIFR